MMKLKIGEKITNLYYKKKCFSCTNRYGCLSMERPCGAHRFLPGLITVFSSQILNLLLMAGSNKPFLPAFYMAVITLNSIHLLYLRLMVIEQVNFRTLELNHEFGRAEELLIRRLALPSTPKIVYRHYANLIKMMIANAKEKRRIHN